MTATAASSWFQSSNMSVFEDAQVGALADEQNEKFEQYVLRIDSAFWNAASGGSMLRFVREYFEVSELMLRTGFDNQVLRPLLQDALSRLIQTIGFARRRTREHFCEQGSAYKFEFDPKIFEHARCTVDKMEKAGTSNQDYDLSNSPEFLKWVQTTLQPIIEGFTGMKVSSPLGELRYHHAEVHQHRWKDRYRRHDFGDFHLDQSHYAFPFIVYLDDVGKENGPFCYIEGSDKEPMNYVLRAFHSAATHHCMLGGTEDKDYATLAALPAVFRGGDRIGAFQTKNIFEQREVQTLTGPAGFGLMFNGFHLLHTGGNPTSGMRKSLFVGFRYPRAKLDSMLGNMVSSLWAFRMRRLS